MRVIAQVVKWLSVLRGEKMQTRKRARATLSSAFPRKESSLDARTYSSRPAERFALECFTTRQNAADTPCRYLRYRDTASRDCRRARSRYAARATR